MERLDMHMAVARNSDGPVVNRPVARPAKANATARPQAKARARAGSQQRLPPVPDRRVALIPRPAMAVAGMGTQPSAADRRHIGRYLGWIPGLLGIGGFGALMAMMVAMLDDLVVSAVVALMISMSFAPFISNSAQSR